MGMYQETYAFNLNFHIKKEAKLQFLQVLFPTANNESCMSHGNCDEEEEEEDKTEKKKINASVSHQVIKNQ